VKKSSEPRPFSIRLPCWWWEATMPRGARTSWSPPGWHRLLQAALCLGVAAERHLLSRQHHGAQGVHDQPAERGHAAQADYFASSRGGPGQVQGQRAHAVRSDVVDAPYVGEFPFVSSARRGGARTGPAHAVRRRDQGREGRRRAAGRRWAGGPWPPPAIVFVPDSQATTPWAPSWGRLFPSARVWPQILTRRQPSAVRRHAERQTPSLPDFCLPRVGFSLVRLRSLDAERPHIVAPATVTDAV